MAYLRVDGNWIPHRLLQHIAAETLKNATSSERMELGTAPPLGAPHPREEWLRGGGAGSKELTRDRPPHTAVMGDNNTAAKQQARAQVEWAMRKQHVSARAGAPATAPSAGADVAAVAGQVAKLELAPEHVAERAALAAELSSLAEPGYGLGSSYDEMSCPMCLEAFKSGDTAMQPCLHALCRSCADGALQQTPPQLRCPVCDACTELTAPLPRHLLLDYSLSTSTRPRCGLCGPHVPAARTRAIARCVQCEMPLCGAHELAHPLDAATALHEVVRDIPSDQSTWAALHQCPRHAQTFNQFCQRCIEPVCPMCVAADHAGTQHVVVNLDATFAMTARARLSAAQHGARRTSDTMLDHVIEARHLEKRYMQHVDGQRQQVNDAFDLFVYILEERRKTLLQELETAAVQQGKNVQEFAAGAQAAWAGVNYAVTLCGRLIAACDESDGPALVAQAESAITTRLLKLADVADTPPLRLLTTNEFIVNSNAEQALRAIGELRERRRPLP